MHRFSSRSNESVDLSALRHARREATANVLSEYVEEAGGTRLRVAEHSRCSTPDDFVAVVENLCVVRAYSTIFLNFSSGICGICNFLACCRFDPGESPTTRKSVFEDTEEVTFPP